MQERLTFKRFFHAALPAAMTLSLIGGAMFASQAHAGDMGAKTDAVIARALTVPTATGWERVIVQYAQPLTLSEKAQIQALHGDIYRHLPLIHADALRIPRYALVRLAALPFVAHISLDGGVTKCDQFTVGSSGADTAALQYGVTGQGVTVAVLDSGIMEHEDLSNQAVKGDDENDNSNGTNVLAHQDMTGIGYSSAGYDGKDNKDNKGNNAVVYDLCGHGTHVAGIIAGNGRASLGKRFFQTFYGIAPQASLVDVRVLDSSGQSTVSTVISGLQWVVSNQAAYHIRVVNLSLGHPVGESYTTDPLCQAVEAAYSAGLVVVCAAGNNGRLNAANNPTLDNEGWGTAYGSINSPGNDPYVITVGAMKQDPAFLGDKSHDRIATYSGHGPTRLDMVLKPDLVAPGNRVISLEASQDYLSANYSATNQVPLSSYMHTKQAAPSNQYFSLSGTSMAAPVVAGAAALLLQANPNLTPDTVKARLMLSADKWTLPNGSADPCTFGAGYLDIPAALQSTVVAAQPTVSPALMQDNQGNVSMTLDRAIWGSSLWGTGVTDLRAVWGSRAIWGSSGIDADRAVWGSNSLAASRAIWGSSVWGDRAIWGSSTSAVDLSSVALNGEMLPSNWNAKALCGGPGNWMQALWNASDGTVSRWSVNAAGQYSHQEYGPYPGWSGVDIKVGTDGVSHLLWARADGQISLWTLDGKGSFTHTEYGPFPGWSAQALAVGPDNGLHVLWTHVNGTLSLWNVGSAGSLTHTEFGPFPDWAARSLSYGPDYSAHVLWTKTDGTISLWTVVGAGAFTHTEYGPFPGWAAKAAATGMDGITHVLWNKVDGTASLWSVDASGGFTHHEYGTYPDWLASALAVAPDGTPRLLWNNTNGAAALWQPDMVGGFTPHQYGPF